MQLYATLYMSPPPPIITSRYQNIWSPSAERNVKVMHIRHQIANKTVMNTKADTKFPQACTCSHRGSRAVQTSIPKVNCQQRNGTQVNRTNLVLCSCQELHITTAFTPHDTVPHQPVSYLYPCLHVFLAWGCRLRH